MSSDLLQSKIPRPENDSPARVWSFQTRLRAAERAGVSSRMVFTRETRSAEVTGLRSPARTCVRSAGIALTR